MENNHISIKNKLNDGLTFKISKFKEQIKKTKPHKHDDYFELIFLNEGEGFHSVESDNYMISTPELYILKPGQLHFWQFTSVPKGFVILFKASEFDAVNEKRLLDLFRKLIDSTPLRLEKNQYPETILSEIFNEYNLQSDYSQEIIHGLLNALFGKLLQIFAESPLKIGLPQKVFDKFDLLLVKECPRLHKVNEFANLLNITPQNLNTICRKQTGKSASELISAQIILEAKRYILHTENTISEIADILSFSDSSNFVKFFKKAVGLTPVQFRQKHFQ